MSPAPASPHDTTNLATQRAEDAQRHRQMLHELADMGMDIARALHRQATAEPAAPEAQPTTSAAAPAPNPAPERAITASAAFDRIARTVRRTIALAHKLSEPDRAPGPSEHSGERRLAARQRAIAAKPYAQMTDAELLELDCPDDLDLDDPDLDGDDEDLPPADTIAAIRRDLGLGLAGLPGIHPSQRTASRDMPQGAQWDAPESEPNLCASAAQRPPQATLPPDRGIEPRQAPAHPAAGSPLTSHALPQSTQHGIQPGTDPPL
jgi:hypothetical protein